MTTPLSIDAAAAAADAALFPSFRPFCQIANGMEITGMIGDSGPPLLLLHGHSQNHMIWHKIARELAHDYTAAATDLRGYGASSKPAGSTRHAEYSKRTVAQDQVEVMRALSFDRFRLCAYDRGAHVAHRLCVDHPLHVERTILLDIAPTLAMYEHTDMTFASAYWHWFFLVQPSPFPETLVNTTPDFYIGKLIDLRRTGLESFAPGAMATYAATIREPACVHTMCENYCTAVIIDLERGHADHDAGKRVSAPLRVLWDEHGVIRRCFEPLELWKTVVNNASGDMVPYGHYVPEEAPEALLKEMRVYFA